MVVGGRGRLWVECEFEFGIGCEEGEGGWDCSAPMFGVGIRFLMW